MGDSDCYVGISKEKWDPWHKRVFNVHSSSEDREALK